MFLSIDPCQFSHGHVSRVCWTVYVGCLGTSDSLAMMQRSVDNFHEQLSTLHFTTMARMVKELT